MPAYKKTLVLGIGGAGGINVAEIEALIYRTSPDLLDPKDPRILFAAADTCERDLIKLRRINQSLRNLTAEGEAIVSKSVQPNLSVEQEPVKRFLLGRPPYHGAGCDFEKAIRLFKQTPKGVLGSLLSLIDSVDMVVLLFSMGKGTGPGASRPLFNYAMQKGKPVIPVMIRPDSVETKFGAHRDTVAETTKFYYEQPICCIELLNDSVIGAEDEKKAYAKLVEPITNMIISIQRWVEAQNGADMSDFHRVIGKPFGVKFGSHILTGTGEVEIPDKASQEELVELFANMLETTVLRREGIQQNFLHPLNIVQTIVTSNSWNLMLRNAYLEALHLKLSQFNSSLLVRNEQVLRSLDAQGDILQRSMDWEKHFRVLLPSLYPHPNTEKNLQRITVIMSTASVSSDEAPYLLKTAAREGSEEVDEILSQQLAFENDEEVENAEVLFAPLVKGTSEREDRIAFQARNANPLSFGLSGSSLQNGDRSEIRQDEFVSDHSEQEMLPVVFRDDDAVLKAKPPLTNGYYGTNGNGNGHYPNGNGNHDSRPRYQGNGGFEHNGNGIAQNEIGGSYPIQQQNVAAVRPTAPLVDLPTGRNHIQRNTTTPQAPCGITTVKGLIESYLAFGEMNEKARRIFATNQFPSDFRLDFWGDGGFADALSQQFTKSDLGKIAQVFYPYKYPTKVGSTETPAMPTSWFWKICAHSAATINGNNQPRFAFTSVIDVAPTVRALIQPLVDASILRREDIANSEASIAGTIKITFESPISQIQAAITHLQAIIADAVSGFDEAEVLLRSSLRISELSGEDRKSGPARRFLVLRDLVNANSSKLDRKTKALYSSLEILSQVIPTSEQALKELKVRKNLFTMFGELEVYDPQSSGSPDGGYKKLSPNWIFYDDKVELKFPVRHPQASQASQNTVQKLISKLPWTGKLGRVSSLFEEKVVDLS